MKIVPISRGLLIRKKAAKKDFEKHLVSLPIGGELHERLSKLIASLDKGIKQLEKENK